MLYALRALFVSVRSDPRHRTAARRGATTISASPLLVFVAAALFLILSILVVDLYRDELRAFGLAFDAEQTASVSIGP